MALPPLSAEFVTTMQPAQPGAAEHKSAYKLFRSSDGKLCVDHGSRAVITKLASQQSVLIDHVKKEATPIQAPQGPAMPQAPQVPGMPEIPKPTLPQTLDVKELGTKMVAGYKAEGKLYTFKPAGVQPPQAVQTVEVWHSPELKIPLVTAASSALGKQTTMLHKAIPGEPPAAVFQIPPGYKVVQLPKPPG